MEYKITISDPKTGKSYNQEIKDEKARRVKGLKIGDTLDGAIIGLSGYTLEITGGSDKSGFPMKKGVKGSARARILIKKGTGYRPKGRIRKKKTVRGQNIDENIVQVNTKVVKAGSKGIDKLLGVTEEEPEAEGEKKEEPKEEVKEEKPEKKEVKAEEEKEKPTKEEKKEDKPKE